MRRKIYLFLVIVLILGISPISIYAQSNDKISSKDSIYFVFTDRFYNGDTSNDLDSNVKDLKAYHGGDFKGIEQKLDYIKGLGFTTIWISPVVDNEPFGYHGYWASDFYKTDEHFGTLADLKSLIMQKKYLQF